MTELRLRHQRSAELLERARRVVAGGESSSARVSPDHVPTVIVSGEGARMRDVDGNEYLDFQAAYGPLLFGHRHPAIVAAVRAQLEEGGTLFAMPHPLNEEVARRIVDLVPSVDQVRFANSGTEALTSIVRLARAATGRPLVLKFEGHYHGWGDALFATLHPRLEELGPEEDPTVSPRVEGLPSGCLDDLVQRSWNRRDLVEKLMAERGRDIAAVICEPIMGNTGVIPPEPGFLSFLRDITREHGSLLIFDEVITGFRVAPGGAQQLYDVRPDLTVLAKAVGGGLPVAALGGRADLLQLFAERRAFHGGTYAGNPLALAGARATLDLIVEGGQALYDDLHRRGARLAEGLKAAADEGGLPAVVNHVGPMVQIYFVREGCEAITSYRDVAAAVVPGRFAAFQNALQDEGVYVHPDQYEEFFVTAAHRDEDIETAVTAAARAVRRVARGSG